LKIIFLNVK